MAADTPIRLGANGKGGARPNSGRKKGNYAITVVELRKQLKKQLGIPFEQMIAEMQLKLFNDFKAGTNIKEAVAFTSNMMKYMITPPQQEINISNNPQEMSDEEIELRAAVLIQRAKLSANEAETTNGQ